MDKRELIDRLKKEGFSRKVVEAFVKVRREDFLSEELKKYAYEDIALPLEGGATISQPYTIAFMLDLLEIGEEQKILEIGSGCGYVLALLSEVTKGEIYGVEIIKSLAEKSRRNLKKYKKIEVYNENGFGGLKKEAPFDRILISAAADKLPEHLYSQLGEGGVLVCPVGNSIFRVRKKKDGMKVREFPGFVFVPLVVVGRIIR